MQAGSDDVPRGPHAISMPALITAFKTSCQAPTKNGTTLAADHFPFHQFANWKQSLGAGQELAGVAGSMGVVEKGVCSGSAW